MNQTVCIFGGTGFIGAQVVRELCRAGYRVKVASRVPERAFDLKPCGHVGQVVGIACDTSPEQIARAIDGCDIVINCIGILYEKGKSRFQKAHAELPQDIARACADHQVARLIHISALGVDKATSRYAQSKRQGEENVMRAFPDATILRPSIVFGAQDSFFNRFAALAKFLPALPLIGGGKTKFQPVYVGDVADAVMAVLKNEKTAGNIYELGGPEVVTFRELYQKMFSVTHQPRVLLPIPYGVARIQGAVMGLLPKPPLTADQVESLKTDNVVQDGALSLHDLGITPTAMDAILPTYLKQYRLGGRFADKKQA